VATGVVYVPEIEKRGGKRERERERERGTGIRPLTGLLFECVAARTPPLTQNPLVLAAQAAYTGQIMARQIFRQLLVIKPETFQTRLNHRHTLPHSKKEVT